eukprot:jgi/Psemu1/299858/fgenesh1_kg.2_\
MYDLAYYYLLPSTLTEDNSDRHKVHSEPPSRNMPRNNQSIEETVRVLHMRYHDFLFANESPQRMQRCSCDVPFVFILIGWGKLF